MDSEGLDTLLHELLSLYQEYQKIRVKMAEACRAIAGKVAGKNVCWTCCWFGGQVCLNARSPFHQKSQPDPMADTCKFYLFTKLPRAELISMVGEGKQKNTPQAKTFATCPKCGFVVSVTRKGRLHPHDAEGRETHGRLASGRKRCTGQLNDSHVDEPTNS